MKYLDSYIYTSLNYNSLCLCLVSQLELLNTKNDSKLKLPLQNYVALQHSQSVSIANYIVLNICHPLIQIKRLHEHLWCGFSI